MGRHLISATLTDDAYDCYSHWVKERRGSEMISRVIPPTHPYNVYIIP